MKKYPSIILSVLLCLSLLCGCAGTEADTVIEQEEIELSLWYCTDCPVGKAAAELSEYYHSLGTGVSVISTAFESEESLFSAAEKELPDMVLCSNTAASVLAEENALWDVSGLFDKSDFISVHGYGEGCIGKSFYPLCLDIYVLFLSAPSYADITDLSTAEGLFSAASAYAKSSSAPFLCLEDTVGCFTAASLNNSRRFRGVRAEDVTNEGFVEAYNALAECSASGGLIFRDDALAAVRNGEAVCALVLSSALCGYDIGEAEILPPCSFSGGRVCSGTAWGISVTSDNDDTASRLFDFMRWLYGADNALHLSTDSVCVPAVAGLEIGTENKTELLIGRLYDEYSTALIGCTYNDYVNQSSFDAQCRAAFEILRQN